MAIKGVQITYPYYSENYSTDCLKVRPFVETNREQVQQPHQEINEKNVEILIERLKAEMPALIKQFERTPSGKVVCETLNTLYCSQIAKAQEFLNENRRADLSRVKCLLHKLLPREYFDCIEQLREEQDPQTIINIMGGQNVVAPQAKEAYQHFNAGKNTNSNK